MHQSLPALLFPEYRRRMLGLLLLRPDEALHGREIAAARVAGRHHHRELGKLAEVGLLKREKRGNQQVYSADTNGPILHRAGQHPAQDLRPGRRAGSGLGTGGASAAGGVRVRLGGPKAARPQAATST